MLGLRHDEIHDGTGNGRLSDVGRMLRLETLTCEASVVLRCWLLSCNGFFCRPGKVSTQTLRHTRMMDGQRLRTPFHGSVGCPGGCGVNRKRVQGSDHVCREISMPCVQTRQAWNKRDSQHQLLSFDRSQVGK